MPKFWMITNRDRTDDGFGDDLDQRSYWVAERGPLNQRANWSERSEEQFKLTLVQAADKFPRIDDPHLNPDQKHVTLFIHGYNNDWDEAATRYEGLVKSLYSGPKSLGICVLFNWPSNGSALGYLPDRMDAERCAPDLSEILNAFYSWLMVKQAAAAANPDDACKAKVSVISHSMGNYVLQKAMQYTWTRNNQPLLVSLITQLLMVAADVDNDLFKSGESSDKSDGDAIANLTYRITALYTGRDEVLGMSAGLKHFGKRRLGRSGLDRTQPVPDNVWDCDCSQLIPAGASNVHSAYFESAKTLSLMRGVLQGFDRDRLVEPS